MYKVGIHAWMVPPSIEAEFALGSGLDRKIESKDLINNHCGFILDCFFFFLYIHVCPMHVS